MNRKKLIITSAILAAVVLIGGLLAYFTDTTEPKSNVFTVGDKVDINLKEIWEPRDGLGIATGETKTKKPTIENVGGVDAYVFMKVVVPKYFDNTASEESKWKEAFSYTVKPGWVKVDEKKSTDSASNVYMYAYATAADSGTMTKVTTTGTTKETAELFDSVTFLPGQTKATYSFTAVDDYSASPSTSEVKKTLNIDITGYGIQTTGLSKTTNASQEATTAQDIYACLAEELSLSL